MRDSCHLNGKSGAVAGLLWVALLYFPWGKVLHTGIAVPEHLGWGLFGVGFLFMALRSPAAVYRSWLLIVGGALLTLPLLWLSAGADVWLATTRVAALWGGGLLLCWLGGQEVTRGGTYTLARLVTLTGLVLALSVLFRHAAPALFALWLPQAGGGWATGGYLQPDLIALWLAVAVVATLHLWLFRPGVWLALALGVLMVSLTLSLRLSALACLAVVSLLMLLAAARGLRRRLLGGVVLLLLAGAGTWLVMTRALHQEMIFAWPTGWAALPQMWRACLALLLSHPIAGMGYGQFAGSLPDGMQLAGLSAQWHPRFMVSHPGSEPLYWAVEGGVLALVGMLLLLAWVVRLLVLLWRQSRRVGGYGHAGSEGQGLLFAALPLLLVTLTAGTPWYQSPLHYLLFLVLTGAAVAWLSEPKATWSPPRPLVLLSRGLLPVAGVVVLWFALTGTRVALALQAAHQSNAKDVTALVAAQRMNPLYMPDDVHFALTVHQLQQFSQTGDKALLAQTEPFFNDFLTRHPDPNIYSMYITVLDKQGKSDAAERVYEDGQRRVPWDRRFAPDAPADAPSPSTSSQHP
ncbi:Wzy polymerase domain-containing protein [Serratia marcescens]|uniref:Wzy polymerase domain-containing protein n=1 Tax=Serratia marcescens TaxID=615 RepID=UPI0024C4C263|nr:Wzy polymerase domain-containing protein [Serratia marcescens]MDK1711651.1 Wzy polymerase domain-containing protein [Serratia marcescens]